MNRQIGVPDVNRPDGDRGALPVPLYEHVKRQISEAILMGDLPEGTILPSETALARQHGVAVGTIRHALAGLAAEGLLNRRRRSGTVVTGRAPSYSLRFFFQYFRLHAADGRLVYSDTEVTALARHDADAGQAAMLALAPHAPVIRIDRLRRVGGQPVMRETLVLPAQRVPGFATRAADVPALLYLHLMHAHGVRISAVRDRLVAGLANAAERRALGLRHPAALLRITAIAFDQAGAPVMLTEQAASTAAHAYVNDIR